MKQQITPAVTQSALTPISRTVPEAIIEEALIGFYKPEHILARSVQTIKPGNVTISFLFPKYERTEDAMGHVSGVQMNAALLEGLYIAVVASIKDGSFPIDSLTVDRFRQHRGDFILFKQEIRFRKMLQENQCGELSIQVGELGDVKLLRDFKRLTFRVEGFLKGKVECLLPQKQVAAVLQA